MDETVSSIILGRMSLSLTIFLVVELRQNHSTNYVTHAQESIYKYLSLNTEEGSSISNRNTHTKLLTTLCEHALRVFQIP